MKKPKEKGERLNKYELRITSKATQKEYVIEHYAANDKEAEKFLNENYRFHINRSFKKI